jgi:hypothetical protein
MDKQRSTPSFDAMMLPAPQEASFEEELAPGHESSSKKGPESKGKLGKKPRKSSRSILEHTGKTSEFSMHHSLGRS